MLELIKMENSSLSEYVKGKKEWECTDQDENTIIIYSNVGDIDYLLNEECSFNFVISCKIESNGCLWANIYRKNSEIVVKTSIDKNNLMESPYNANMIIHEIKGLLEYTDEMRLVEFSSDEYGPYIDIEKRFLYNNNAISIVNEFILDIRQLISQAEICLGAFTWKQEYYLNERIFCEQVITPLLKRMDFMSIKFNHGANEFGKDYILSDNTPFGTTRYYGIQVKAGNIDGGVKSKVDEIINQIKDAFEIPFLNLNTNSECYISTLLIIISGKYTSNAKQKIINKIPKGVIGSTIFLEKLDIENLIEKYWCKAKG
jgi:hypothetical protein